MVREINTFARDCDRRNGRYERISDQVPLFYSNFENHQFALVVLASRSEILREYCPVFWFKSCRLSLHVVSVFTGPKLKTIHRSARSFRARGDDSAGWTAGL